MAASLVTFGFQILQDVYLSSYMILRRLRVLSGEPYAAVRRSTSPAPDVLQDMNLCSGMARCLGTGRPSGVCLPHSTAQEFADVGAAR